MKTLQESVDAIALASLRRAARNSAADRVQPFRGQPAQVFGQGSTFQFTLPLIVEDELDEPIYDDEHLQEPGTFESHVRG